MSGHDDKEAAAVAVVVYIVVLVVFLAVGLCGLVVVACRGCSRRKSDGRVLAPPTEPRAAGHYPTPASYPLLQPQPQPQPQLAAAPPNAHQPPPSYNQPPPPAYNQVLVSNQKQPPYSMNAPY